MYKLFYFVLISVFFSCNKSFVIPDQKIIDFKEKYIELLDYLNYEFKFSSLDNDSCSYEGFEFSDTSNIYMKDLSVFYFRDRFFINGKFYESYTFQFNKLSFDFITNDLATNGEGYEIDIFFDEIKNEFKITRKHYKNRHLDYENDIKLEDPIPVNISSGKFYSLRELYSFYNSAYSIGDKKKVNSPKICEYYEYLLLVPYKKKKAKRINFILLKQDEELFIISILTAKYNKRKEILEFEEYVDLKNALGEYPFFWTFKSKY